MRKYSVPQRAPAWPSMTTEYQESFIPPCCHRPIISTTRQKNPYHPLKGTSADSTTFKSTLVTHKWVKKTAKAPQSSMAPKDKWRCSGAPHDLTGFVANQLESKVENYTSVYKNDFPAWKTNLRDSLKVNQGVAGTSKEGHSQKYPARVGTNCQPVPQQLQPFESITIYRSDYITHAVQPRTNRGKPEQQTRPAAWEINQEPFSDASEFFKHFKKWSLETKFHGHGKAKACCPPANHKLVSTTHTDFTPHKCQRTKPILPFVQTSEKSKEPLQATTTMKEDYKAWNVPRRTPIVPKDNPIWSNKTPCSKCRPAAADSWKTNPKLFNPLPRINETAACRSSFNATEKPRYPADYQTFSGFECISKGNEETRMYWSTCMNGTCPDSGACKDPSQTRQIIQCMISSRS